MNKRTFISLASLVANARLAAAGWLYDGRCTPETIARLQRCGWFYLDPVGEVARLIYTRDVGHHSGGWWKNPDYERCLHLSISFVDRRTGEPQDFDTERADKIAAAFWADDRRKAWIEKPYSDEGKSNRVWHYRLFCDPAWSPIQPRGEVYSKDDTPADWRSFSEIHGYKPEPEDAPFLLEANDE